MQLSVQGLKGRQGFGLGFVHEGKKAWAILRDYDSDIFDIWKGFGFKLA